MKKFLSMLLAVPVWAANIPISVIGVTPTQAVIRYTATADSACTLAVTNDGALAPTVWDVSSAKFSGSNQDTSRASTLSQGRERTVVLGKRTSEQGGDGRMYSRALQADTPHTVTVTCGADSGTATFKTANIPLGGSYPEPPPFNSAGFGNYAWPSIDWTSTATVYVDPLTGLAVKRVTDALWHAKNQADKAFTQVFDINSAWTNPNNAKNWPNPASRASYAGANSDPLFLAIDVSALGVKGSGWRPNFSLSDVRFKANGNGDNATASNRNVLICLSLYDSGATCDTPEQAVTLPQSSNGDVQYPSSFSTISWSSWSTPPIPTRDFGTSSGNVNTSGTSVTATGSSPENYFNRNWKSGAKILINGVVYTVNAVNSSTSLTLTSSAGTQTGVPYKSLAAGFRIRKQTGTGTITLAAGWDYAEVDDYNMGFNGAQNICSSLPNTVTVDADGNSAPARTAYLCMNQRTQSTSYAVLYAFFPDNGEARLLSNFEGTNQNYSPDAGDITKYSPDHWDESVSTRFWASIHFTAPADDWGLARVDYTGDFRAWKPGVVSGSWPSDSLTVTPIMRPSDSKGLKQQIQTGGYTDYDSSVWPINATYQVNFVGPSGGYGYISLTNKTYSEAPTLIAIVNLSTGNLVTVKDTWKTYPIRFGQLHTPMGWAGKLYLAMNYSGRFGPDANSFWAGPWAITPTQVYKAGSWTSDTSLTNSYADACSAGLPQWLKDLGATGNNCVKIRAKEPCSSTPNTSSIAEATKYPCPWNASYSMLSATVLGDEFNDGGASGDEAFRIVSKTDIGGGSFEFELQRFVSRTKDALAPQTAAPYPTAASTHANGWTGKMIPPKGSSVATWWLDSSGNFTVEAPYLTAGHSEVGPGPTSGSYTMLAEGAVNHNLDYGARFNRTFSEQVGQATNIVLNGSGKFLGGSNGSLALQSYPSMRQQVAPASEKVWFLDYRHLNPGGGTNPEYKSSAGTIAYSLVNGTSGVYKFTTVAGTKNQRTSPLIVHAGRFLFKDMSSASAGDQITDATPWKYCYAMNAGECRTGSSAGDVYVSLPKADTGATECTTNWLTQTFPCAWVPSPSMMWVWQMGVDRSDNDALYRRRLSMAFTGPGRAYHYSNMVAVPTGDWGLTACHWCDGVRSDILAVKIPRWPSYDGVNRAEFVKVPVKLAGETGDTVRVRFGYLENGNPTDFYCTGRTEACYTDGSGTQPFLFATETQQYTSCGSGCTVNVPGISGRVLYYQVLRKRGAVEAAGPVRVVTVP